MPRLPALERVAVFARIGVPAGTGSPELAMVDVTQLASVKPAMPDLRCSWTRTLKLKRLLKRHPERQT